MAEEEVAVEPSEMDTPEAAVTEEVSEEPGELYSIKIDGEEQNFRRVTNVKAITRGRRRNLLTNAGV